MSRRYRWSGGNRVELLIEGKRFFPRMLQAINAARQTLLLEFYMVSSGKVANQFIEALIAAAQRGVKVCWLIDDIGGRRFTQQDRERLARVGVQVLRYNPISVFKFGGNLIRDHRKLMIVDQRVGFIGGTGISDEYLRINPLETELAWHDVMLQVEGAVVENMVQLFAQQWHRSEGVMPPISLPDRRRIGDALARVTQVEGLKIQQIKRSFVQHVNQAQQRVWLETAYFMPVFSVRRSLRQAALRGVDVRLIVAGPNTDHPWIYHASKRYYRRLLQAGVRIYEYQTAFLHAKIGLCDQWVSVGSCNLDHWNLRWNLEANLEVVEPGLTAAVELMLVTDMQHSREICYDQWSNRPWYQKLKEVSWSLLCQLLLKIR
ncbi:phospholipase D-like domain-containing protein [Amphritea sp. 1_MG-2023]|uniref:phospholipase D-like domain-containing protein n=1 Tax=Amphritea sp. 1_MG-2023 TaxID=3062670 RepID=UPI0026E3FEC6|nr:phospholipase D-like domain-containing protein [Amphritea sp. 1_MG-2023]MDO6562020.1 phospholipase D-like domain-containing protein [Amphritea sp. 1_MG-2023]